VEWARSRAVLREARWHRPFVRRGSDGAGRVVTRKGRTNVVARGSLGNSADRRRGTTGRGHGVTGVGTLGRWKRIRDGIWAIGRGLFRSQVR